MLALRQDDGLDRVVSYVQPPAGPGVYEPTSGPTPVGVRLPHVTPLALNSAAQFRPPGPPLLPGREYARDIDEVQRSGRIDGPRTPEQTAIARFWTDHDVAQWNRNLLRLADARRLSAIDTREFVHPTPFPNLDVMPAGPGLADLHAKLESRSKILKLRIFIDRGSIEVFVNDGESVLSSFSFLSLASFSFLSFSSFAVLTFEFDRDLSETVLSFGFLKDPAFPAVV